MFQMFRYLASGDYISFFIQLIAKAFILLCVLPVHEFAHAWTADKLGDPTARQMGRLTLNPLKHLDLWGSLLILFTGFGYAKPVPVNIRNFKDRKKGFAITAAAGPISNLLMALFYFFFSNVFALFSSNICVLLSTFLYFVGSININLAVFNLLPIPPLDGSRLFTVFIPDRYYYKILQYERYIMLALLLLMFTGALSTPLSRLTSLCSQGINFIASLPFRLFS